MNIYLSMAAFALAASITPGPVNIVALSAGAQFGFGATQRHVFGATLGFTLLLMLLGLGMHQLLTLWPALTRLIQWAGVAFLLFMAYRLAFDDGRLGNGAARAPSALRRTDAMAESQGVAGVGGQPRRLCRRRRHPAAVAVRRALLRDLLCLGGLLGLCRRDAARPP